MRRFILTLSTLAVAIPAVAHAQSLAARVSRIRDGTVRMSFATRSNVCGDGRFIGIDLPDAFWTYTVSDNGFSINALKDVQPDCRAGPLRLVVVNTGGNVTELRAAVGVEWRRSETATDLGMVSAPEAADWLIGLAERGDDGVARLAFLAASVADSTHIAGRVIGIARNRRLSANVRERAIRWLTDIAGADGEPGVADDALRAVASDETESAQLRERAVRELRPVPANREYLRTLYRKAHDEPLRERILRQLGSGATADDVAWVRDVALDTREAAALRERAVRVLGEDLERSDDVRDLYAKLDHVALKERALRVVAEHDDRGAVAWLRQIAEDAKEDIMLRERAIRLLAQSGAPSADLASLYDLVDASALKQRLVRLLGERADDAAVRKLSAIAAGDPDPAMRREASRRLEERTKSL